jgi:integrase
MGHKFLDESEIHSLLEAAKENPRDYALLHMAASTLLRASDLLSIKKNEVIDSDGEIVRFLRIKMRKTRKWIERPLREDCREALSIWLKTRSDRNPYLFIPALERHNKTGKPLHRFAYHKIIKGYLMKTNHKSALQGTSTHTLRRSVAKLVYKKTNSIVVAQKALGHTSPVSTGHYIDPHEINETANKTILEDINY